MTTFSSSFASSLPFGCVSVPVPSLHSQLPSTSFPLTVPPKPSLTIPLRHSSLIGPILTPCALILTPLCSLPYSHMLALGPVEVGALSSRMGSSPGGKNPQVADQTSVCTNRTTVSLLRSLPG